LRRNHRLTYAEIARRMGASIATGGAFANKPVWQSCRLLKRRRLNVTSVKHPAKSCIWT
jgi:hypothetical protein